MSSREPAAQPAGLAGLSVRDFKPTDFKSVVVYYFLPDLMSNPLQGIDHFSRDLEKSDG
jgi:hypothetical protein